MNHCLGLKPVSELTIARYLVKQRALFRLLNYFWDYREYFVQGRAQELTHSRIQMFIAHRLDE